jgi:predicted permease
MDELKLAARRLTKRPGAALASIVTLACAIGAAAATFSLLSAVLLHPLPVDAADRLFVIETTSRSGAGAGKWSDHHLYPLYPQIRDSGIFERVAAGGSWSGLLVSIGGAPQGAAVYFASHDFFDVLGVRIPIGRGFTMEEDRRGAPLVAILSERYWRRTFDADTGVIGRVITVAGKPTTIVGVAPRGFPGLNLAGAPDLYLPLHTIADAAGALAAVMNFFADASHPSSPTAWLTIVGRLRATETDTQAIARLATLPPLPSWRASGRPSQVQFGLTAVNAAAVPAMARAGMAQFTRLLGVTVGLLLFIGCATVGMLLLVRTEARREEFAMCLALGASRARLARGVAFEGAMVSLAGAALALPIAQWLFAGLRTFQLPGHVSIELLDLTVDMRALALSAGCAVAATLMIALIAGVFGFSADIADALRSRAGATPRIRRRGTRTMLVGGQVAVALVLLAGAGLFVRSLMAALSLNPGFDTGRIVTGGVSLTSYGYTPIRATAFFDDLAARLRANPAIRFAAMTGFAGGMGGGRLTIDGQPRENLTVPFTAIDHHYFETIGAHIVKGRDFSGDDTEHSPLVGIVSESFGRLIAYGGDPTGHRITMPFWRPPAPPPVVEIVGVVPDLITNVSTLEPLVLYVPLAQQEPSTSRTVVLRAAADANAARREAMSTIRQLDARVTLGGMLTIDEQIGTQMSAQRFGIVVLGVLGVIAVLLTVLGTYVLAESMAVMRMREMGIRAALGASRRQLAAIVLAETGRLIGFGLAAGLLLAWMGAGLIRAFLFRVQPFDPATLVGVSALILFLALAVSLRPALHAASVDLGRVLKEE